MSGNQHPKSKRPSDADMENDPGIGTSKGTIKEGDELEHGENTVEGDVENDTTSTGGINPRQKIRTNK
ncbi:hypothetical protein FJW07_17245 [Mesorhizobium sp. B3-1-9]|uniref:hypothetical protein n=1 Tax=unclassified Mesorhizobium TaxID=325217 RepID=UPI001129E6C2|nr:MULTISPECIES: hypothetical protein [unclassified Mesorhizobium]TPI38190.1 hypothetical protein FJW07_17245 [Mesorhizobium sp. B3-1-9]TPI44405.1 hypothetical protein FJ414_01410 [Mesorhizobium sp. B3-1-6]TPI59029.1 hypothetical protein FJ417_17035 [Mesorhizobium sp. B3-1-7]TPI69588.1 hypothetical protein FJ424_05470 [Mesorhizobium sp. B3-1-8]TPI73740.1 hypothetical protein FJ420_07625 [Mesorhizobium sp. B3-1-3]